MTADILPQFKQDITEMILVPSDGGRFEILLNDEPIYSKLETGQFPEHRDIIKAISAKMRS